MSDLRWLCEVAHTWGRNTRGTMPVRGLTIGGDHVRRRRRGALQFLQAWPRHNEGISSVSGPIRVMSFVVPKSPLGVCDCFGATHWNQDAEAIINEVVRREYDKLR